MVERLVIKFSRKKSPYLHWEYLQQETGNRLRIVPEKGGLITEWRCEGEEVLYFDQNRFLTTNKSVRGGIPILFPICGDLSEDLLSSSSVKYNLNQHGFARDSSWEIKLLEDKLGVALQLSDSKASRSIFPYTFTIEIEARLKNRRLYLDVIIKNSTQSPMPFGFGFHPYFKVLDIAKVKIKGLNKKCINQLNMKEEPTDKNVSSIYKGVDFISGPSEKVQIIDSVNQRSIQLEQYYPMDLTVVWSDPPRQMVCVEPWTSPRNSLISGERRFEINGGCEYILRSSILYE